MNFTNVYPDIRPIGPSGTRLASKPGGRHGFSWEYEGEYPLEILTVTVSPSSVLAGTGILNPVFTISYRGTPSGVNITSAGTGYKNLTSPFTSFTWLGTFPTGYHNTQRGFTINATGLAGNTVSATVLLPFLPRAYHAAASTGVTFDEAFIKSLTSTNLVSGHFGVLNTDTSLGEAMFYAAVTDNGTPRVIHRSSNMGFLLTQATGNTINVTNEAGYTAAYSLWRTDYDNAGEQIYNLDGAN